MYIDYTPEEKKLRDELRAYFDRLITDEVLAEYSNGGEGGGPLYTKVLKQMGADGWLGIGWPKEFGGQDRSPIEQYIFFDEVQRAGFPIPFLTLCTVGPTLMKYGTDEQKSRFLPSILRGETHFAIGYSEPDAGTDLASLKTKAVKDGDDYVVTGQKVFTSQAEYADHIWLAVRTDPDAPKHKGITVLIVDTKSPGFSLTPIHTMGGNRTNMTYYDNVRVPGSMRVGRENEGWKLITTQLNHERVALSAPGPSTRFVEEITAWARETRLANGKRVIDTPWVQQNLARAHAMIDVLKLMTWRQAANIQRGVVDPAESSAVKVYGSESFIRIYQLLQEVLGQAGYLRDGSPGALLRGRLEMYARVTLVFTFGGGTNEVQRDIIGAVGLGLPRSRLPGGEIMDFSFDETQKAIAELSRKIFTDRVTQEALRAAEADPDRFQRGLWKDLAASDLLGVAIPDSHGGSGQGLLALCALLQEAGAATAFVPLWQTLALGALPIARFGTDAQKSAFLPRVASGDCILTAALIEQGSDDPLAPATSARKDGAGYRLDGEKFCVPAAHLAERVLVAARAPGGRAALFLVDPKGPGVTLAMQYATNHEAEAVLTLKDAPAEALGDPAAGEEQLAWLRDRATIGLCAMELGIVERALRMTATYTTNRHQFDRPLATFQAVSQRLADAYIDVETVRLSTWQAAWRLDAGHPASDDVARAKLWAAEAGHRVVLAAQHLHGGMGFDRDYPLHRYYTWSRRIELTLGCASRQLERLGVALAGLSAIGSGAATTPVAAPSR